MTIRSEATSAHREFMLALNESILVFTSARDVFTSHRSP
jgi:hypothetical protein